MKNNETIQLRVSIEGLGDREISFDTNQLLSQIKEEHLIVECPENHTLAQADSIDFYCPTCEGSGYIRTNFGKVVSAICWQRQRVWGKSTWRRSQEILSESQPKDVLSEAAEQDS